VEIFEIVLSAAFEIQMCRGCAGARVHAGSPVVPDSSDPEEPELVLPVSDVSPVSSVADDELVELIDADEVDAAVVVVGSPVVELDPDSVSPSPLGARSSPQPHSHNDITNVDQAFMFHPMYLTSSRGANAHRTRVAPNSTRERGS
jgi:hypothetical protein